MAAIRCAAAGRALLRRSPGLLRRAAGVGERGMPTAGGALAPSSNRYISTLYFMEYEKKKLAAELMKEPGTSTSTGREIEKMDELLGLLGDNDAAIDEVARQAGASRREIEDKKHELVSLLLRPRSGMTDNGTELRKMVEELAILVRRHRESLVLEDLKARCTSVEEQQAKMIVGLLFWGVPLTLVTMIAQSH